MNQMGVLTQDPFFFKVSILMYLKFDKRDSLSSDMCVHITYNGLISDLK